jgi:hypothetical protein
MQRDSTHGHTTLPGPAVSVAAGTRCEPPFPFRHLGVLGKEATNPTLLMIIVLTFKLGTLIPINQPNHPPHAH